MEISERKEGNTKRLSKNKLADPAKQKGQGRRTRPNAVVHPRPRAFFMINSYLFHFGGQDGGDRDKKGWGWGSSCQ